MSLHVMVHSTTPSGELSTIWERPKVETLPQAEALVRSGIAKARRAGGVGLKIDVFDDLTCRSVFRARLK